MVINFCALSCRQLVCGLPAKQTGSIRKWISEAPRSTVGPLLKGCMANST